MSTTVTITKDGKSKTFTMYGKEDALNTAEYLKKLITQDNPTKLIK